MLIQRKIQVSFPIVQIFPSPQQTYIAIQVALQLQDLRAMVYRQDTLELIHQHEEKNSNFLYISFDETEQQMLVYAQIYQDENYPKIKIYRVSDFEVVKEIQLRSQLQAAYFQNETLLILFNRGAQMVQCYDLETKNTLDILSYGDAGVCPSINQVDLVKEIRKLNPHFIYESMNQDKYLVVLSSQNNKYRNNRFLKFIKYDEERDYQIVRTSRLFHKFKEDNYDYFCLKICQNSQFKVLYQYHSTLLIKGHKIVRKYKQVNYLKCIPIRYPMKRIMIPQISSITFL